MSTWLDFITLAENGMKINKQLSHRRLEDVFFVAGIELKLGVIITPPPPPKDCFQTFKDELQLNFKKKFGGADTHLHLLPFVWLDANLKTKLKF